jgi:hypothetical protein
MSHASGIVASPELVSEFAKAKDDASVRFIQVQVHDVVLVTKQVGAKEGDNAAGCESPLPSQLRLSLLIAFHQIVHAIS